MPALFTALSFIVFHAFVYFLALLSGYLWLLRVVQYSKAQTKEDKRCCLAALDRAYLQMIMALVLLWLVVSNM